MAHSDNNAVMRESANPETGSSQSISDSVGREPGGGSNGQEKVSCIEHFDALWFCYSPVYQTTHYYREGVFDSCFGKWRALSDCLLLRTKFASLVQQKHEETAAAAAAVPHIWTMRSREESEAFWRACYGDRSGPSPSTSEQTASHDASPKQRQQSNMLNPKE
eukprot:TRINITY_DN10715_c0_g1_i1.p2 TRINITY_DN10715_c0_g1~~TRINITY_DN10715_c0_g1_i1.p2  ORF type:complete len:163 (+),score=28.74 TRINITY_DN10715_c0_g1_i1:122-610(+)